MKAAKKKVYGSQSAFMYGDTVVSKYNSGCMRSILLASYGIRDKFDPKHQVRGLLNEERFEQKLKDKGVTYERETAIIEDISNFPDTIFTGRLDYFLPEAQTVIELKSTESPSVNSEVIKKGKFNLQNLAQLVAYMVGKRVATGQLIYTFYKVEKSTKVYQEAAERVFNVAIDGNGHINVNKVRSGFTVYDQLKHRQTAAKVVNENLLWTRPLNWSSFDGACKFCPFRATCDALDCGVLESTEDFINSAKNNLSTIK